MGDAMDAELRTRRTHYEDCWLVYHDCAIAKVKRLQAGINQLRRELHDERVRRDEWEKMYNRLVSGTEIKQLQAELAQTNIERIAETRAATLWTGIAQEREQELEAVWAKLDRVRQDAQDQSDEVQELWLSPCEAEGLKQQLAKTEAQVTSVKQAVEWLWGFWDGNTLIARSSGYEEEIGAAWDKLLKASGAFSKQVERLPKDIIR